MKAAAERSSKSTLRNYQLSSLGSNSNVKSIIASMSGAEEAPPPVLLDTSSSRSLPRDQQHEKRKHLVGGRLREKSQKNPSDVLKSISVDSGGSRHSSAEEDFKPNHHHLLKKKESPLVVNSASEVKKRPDSLGFNGDNNGGCIGRKGDVMASQNSGNGIRNKMDNNSVKSKGKRMSPGHGHCPYSSDNNEEEGAEDNDDCESEMSSAEESSEELESSPSSSSASSSSSSSTDDVDEKANGGGLEPISEERSLRIDLPDLSSKSGSKRSRQRKKKIIEDLAVDDNEDEDDGNCKPLIDWPNHNETNLATVHSCIT